MIYLMPALWGYVGILGLPLSGGPTGPYLEGVPCHKIKKKNKRSYHFIMKLLKNNAKSWVIVESSYIRRN